MRYFLTGFALALLFGQAAVAAILVDEEFTHADGGLTGQTPTPGPGGAWASHSGGTNKAIQVTSGEISLTQSGGSGQDVNTDFTAIGTGETLYAGFDVRLPSGQTVDPDVNGLYFAHFLDGTTVFRSRVFVTAPAGGGDFGIGLDNNSAAPSVFWATDLSFDTTYRIIVSYDFDSGDSELWIDAATAADTSIVDNSGVASTAIDAFAFRQTDDYTGSQVIDNLIVSDSFPEAVPVELMSFSIE